MNFFGFFAEIHIMTRRRLLLLLLFYSFHAICANRSPAPEISTLPSSISSSSVQHTSSPSNVKNIHNKNNLKSIKTDCTKDHFHIQLDLGKPFKGVVFAKEFTDECSVKGIIMCFIIFNILVIGFTYAYRAETKKNPNTKY